MNLQELIEKVSAFEPGTTVSIRWVEQQDTGLADWSILSPADDTPEASAPS